MFVLNAYICFPLSFLRFTVSIPLAWLPRIFQKTVFVQTNTIMNNAVIENISNIENLKANYLLIDISYESDIHKASKIIQNVVKNHPLCIDQRSQEEKDEGKDQIAIHCLEFKDSSISLRASVYTSDNPSGFQLLSDCRILIKEEFDKQGVVIPYPQLVVTNH